MGARSGQLELGAYLDAALEAARDRAEARVEPVHAFDLLTPVLLDSEPVVNGYPPDHEHLVLEHHLADRLDLVALRIDLDVTRLQRAGEGASQSAASGRHDVVERGRMWGILVRADTVMLRDLGMDPERHRLVLSGQVREPLRAAQPLDFHTRCVRRLGGHQRRPYLLAAGRPGRRHATCPLPPEPQVIVHDRIRRRPNARQASASETARSPHESWVWNGLYAIALVAGFMAQGRRASRRPAVGRSSSATKLSHEVNVRRRVL